MRKLTTQPDTTSVNDHRLSRTTSLESFQWADALREAYASKDHCDVAMASIMNAIYTEKRPVFVLSRKLVGTLLTADTNTTLTYKDGIGSELYGRLIHKLLSQVIDADGRVGTSFELVEKAVPGSREADIYALAGDDAAAFFEAFPHLKPHFDLLKKSALTMHESSPAVAAIKAAAAHLHGEAPKIEVPGGETVEELGSKPGVTGGVKVEKEGISGGVKVTDSVVETSQQLPPYKYYSDHPVERVARIAELVKATEGKEPGSKLHLELYNLRSFEGSPTESDSEESVEPVQTVTEKPEPTVIKISETFIVTDRQNPQPKVSKVEPVNAEEAVLPQGPEPIECDLPTGRSAKPSASAQQAAEVKPAAKALPSIEEMVALYTEKKNQGLVCQKNAEYQMYLIEDNGEFFEVNGGTIVSKPEPDLATVHHWTVNVGSWVPADQLVITNDRRKAKVA